ncbi:MAG: hypothetical protein ACI8Z9_002026, partial [Paraglaciecola sp.]
MNEQRYNGRQFELFELGSSLMISSMTAFARRELTAEWGTAIWEIRSVNQR